jgi:hypothetical protein
MNDATAWAVFALGGLLVLVVGYFLLRWIWRGAVVLFWWAGDQAFLGVIAYAAAWVFLFPLMLVASLALGAVIAFAEKPIREEQRRERRVERWRAKNLGESRSSKGTKTDIPPDDPEERHKWANRLPPYD